MQSTGQTATQAVSLVPMQGWAMMWAMNALSLAIDYRGRAKSGNKKGTREGQGEENQMGIRERPVISGGLGRSSIIRAVGATSARRPPVRSFLPLKRSSMTIN